MQHILGHHDWYTKCGEEGMEVVNEASSACEVCTGWGSKNLDPARKVITYLR